uniref:Pseudouridine-5'-phosphate glycosidase n=1 Tax=Plectus sambesii TaxID=2011161 RepID=A0A914UM51_9BILA
MNGIFRHLRRLSTNSFVVAEEVREAVKSGSAVVALESTVITHGLPYPENIRAAQSLEQVVRQEGAVPATIALLNGRVHVGLSNTELEQIAAAKDAVKVSRRDLPIALAKGRLGGTTVAATMFLAHRAGISTFATGGIGGVHRGAEQTFDISADLIELGRTPVTVVCAGVKSILDVRKTLEYLETQSVPVVVFGDSNIFPGFFSATSDCKAPFSTSSIDDLVDICEHSASLGLSAAPLIACPIPQQHAAAGMEIEEAIQKALREANAAGIRSQDVTPYLLRRVNELTQGKSLIA